MSTCNSYLMTSKSILLLRYQVLYLSTTIINPPYSTVYCMYFITSSTFISLDLTRSVELNVGVVVVGTEVSGGGRGR